MTDRPIVCGNCGTSNPASATFCAECGALLAAYASPSGAEQPADVPAAGAPPPATPSPSEPVTPLEPSLTPVPETPSPPTPSTPPIPDPPPVPPTPEIPPLPPVTPASSSSRATESETAPPVPTPVAPAPPPSMEQPAPSPPSTIEPEPVRSPESDPPEATPSAGQVTASSLPSEADRRDAPAVPDVIKADVDTVGDVPAVSDSRQAASAGTEPERRGPTDEAGLDDHAASVDQAAMEARPPSPGSLPPPPDETAPATWSEAAASAKPPSASGSRPETPPFAAAPSSSPSTGGSGSIGQPRTTSSAKNPKNMMIVGLGLMLLSCVLVVSGVPDALTLLLICVGPLGFILAIVGFFRTVSRKPSF